MLVIVNFTGYHLKKRRQDVNFNYFLSLWSVACTVTSVGGVNIIIIIVLQWVIWLSINRHWRVWDAGSTKLSYVTNWLFIISDIVCLEFWVKAYCRQTLSGWSDPLRTCRITVSWCIGSCLRQLKSISDHVCTHVLVGTALPCLKWPSSAVLATCLSEVPPPSCLVGMQENCLVIAITVYW